MLARPQFDTAVQTRRLAYACCAGEAVYQYVRFMELGDPCCAEEHLRKAELLMWGERMMRSYAISGESDGCCVTSEEACKVMNIIDPLCPGCRCEDTRLSGDLPVVPPPLPPCDLVGSYTDTGGNTVLSFIPGGSDGIVPAIADPLYAWAFTSGTYLASEDFNIDLDPPNPPTLVDQGAVFTWDANTFALNVIGQVGPTQAVEDAITGIWWQTGNSTMWPLFPEIQIQVGPTGVTIASLAQWENEQQLGLRSVRLEYTINGTDWVVFGPQNGIAETVFASGTTLPLDGLGVENSIAWRITYIAGYCEYGPFSNPFSGAPVGDIYLYIGTSSSLDSTLYIYKGTLDVDPEPFTNIEAEPTVTSGFVGAETVRVMDRVTSSNIAAGGGGTASLLISTDNGASFAPAGGAFIQNATDFCNDIFAAKDSTHVWAILGLTRCALSSDQGATYSEISMSTIQSAGDQPTVVAAYDGQEAIIGGRDSIWRTTDGGSTWTEVNSGMQSTSEVILLDNDVALAFDEQGVWRSTDRGANWQFISADTLFAGSVSVFDCGYVGTTVFTSTGWVSRDSGLTWSDTGLSALMNPYQPGGWSRVLMINLQTVIVSNSGFLWRTDDGGTTWTSVYNQTTTGRTMWGLEYDIL